MKNRIIVVGCGPHFQKRHFVSLSEMHYSHSIEIVLAIDMASQKQDVLDFFSNQNLKPLEYLFLPEVFRNNISIEMINSFVLERIDIRVVDGILIMTEPKVHKDYIVWAQTHGIDIFCDKPLTAFKEPKDYASLSQDYKEILSNAQRKKNSFVLSCQRRDHPGFLYVKETIDELVREYGIPVTYVDIHYGDGKWIMPSEYSKIENHPYKYGYGVLLHSGYHYIDLLAYLFSSNKLIYPDFFDAPEIATSITSPEVVMEQIGFENYANLLKTYHSIDMDTSEYNSNNGEIDAFIHGSFQVNNYPISSFSLKLLQNTVSQRSWSRLPKDAYTGNGRVHTEQVIVHIGPICSIFINHQPYHKLSPDLFDEEFFTIDMIFNSDITGRKKTVHMTKQDLEKKYPRFNNKKSLNIEARKIQLECFMKEEKSNTDLDSHQESIKLLDLIYKNIYQKNSYSKRSPVLQNR